jgi:hypothetical protein
MDRSKSIVQPAVIKYEHSSSLSNPIRGAGKRHRERPGAQIRIFPHPPRGILFLGADGIGIDGGVLSWACPSHFCTRLSGMPAVTAVMPKPCRSPLGEAGTPARPAARITACTARQPVIGDDGQSRM